MYKKRKSLYLLTTLIQEKIRRYAPNENFKQERISYHGNWNFVSSTTSHECDMFSTTRIESIDKLELST